MGLFSGLFRPSIRSLERDGNTARLADLLWETAQKKSLSERDMKTLDKGAEALARLARLSRDDERQKVSEVIDHVVTMEKQGADLIQTILEFHRGGVDELRAEQLRLAGIRMHLQEALRG
jgi:hypothetical protein